MPLINSRDSTQTDSSHCNIRIVLLLSLLFHNQHLPLSHPLFARGIYYFSSAARSRSLVWNSKRSTNTHAILTFYNQSKPSHISSLSILILSPYLRVGPPSHLFLSVFPQKPFVPFCSLSCVSHATSYAASFVSSSRHYFVISTNYKAPPKLKFFHHPVTSTFLGPKISVLKHPWPLPFAYNERSGFTPIFVMTYSSH